MWRRWATALVWVVPVVGGCDGDSPSEGADTSAVTATDATTTQADTSAPDDTTVATTDDTTSAPDVVMGDPDVLVGSFVVTLVEPSGEDPGLTSVLGTVYDGPTPSPVDYHEQDVPDGDDPDCRLMVPDVPFCEDLCVGGAICTTGGVCTDYPNAMDLGRVALTGLGDAIYMDPIGGTYQPLGSSLPYPAFAAGGEIAIATTGGAYQPFAIQSVGIAPLDLTSTDLVVAEDQPLALTWTAGSVGSARVTVKLDISHHGGNKGVILCDTADDGSLTLSAPLVTTLLDLGIAGHPTVVVTRHTVTSKTIEPGRVDLEVLSDIEVGVTIPGLESCFGDEDCSDGKTCQDDLTCQ